MKIGNSVVVAVFCGLMVGCGSGDEGEEPQGAIPEHQLKALDKAKGTEQMLLDAEEKRKKEMEERGI